jgi:glycosyltransferase involved in cell wall biosynthesis
MDPLVSVIIPTFNRAGVICRTIDNIFQQTYGNFELIVVDDGSTDDTPSLLRRYSNRIRVITQENAGPAVARNQGARAARGEIIAFQDSDDLWKPTKLERQVALLVKTDASVPCCLCNADMGVVHGVPRTSFDYSSLNPERDEGLWLNVMEILATRFVLFNQTVAIRRKVFERVGGFDETLKYLEDYDLPLRLSLEGPWAFVREPLVIYCGPSAESFSQQALKEPLTLKACEVAIFERISARVKGDDRYAGAQRYLERRLRIFQWAITEIRLRGLNFIGARMVGNVMAKLGRYRESLFRHSPRYPQMLTAPVE